MPNGPVLVDIVFQVLENALPTSTSLRRAGGPLGRHQHPTHRFARNTTPSTPATDSSRVAPPPVQPVECLQAGKQKTRRLCRPTPRRDRERCVTKGTRDPSSPASGGTFKLSGLPRSGTLLYPLIVTSPALGQICCEKRKRDESQKTTQASRPISDEHVLPPNVLTSLPVWAFPFISHDRPRM